MELETAAAILVGGHSRRMGGQPKATLPLGDRMVLERVLDVAEGLGHPIYLVGAHDGAASDPTLRRLLDRLDRPVLTDRRDDAGPLGGLDTAFSSTGAHQVLLLACDLPFLTTSFLSFLLEQAADAAAVVPAEDDTSLHPLCAVYGRGCHDELRRRLDAGQLRVHDFAAAVGAYMLPRRRWQQFDALGRLLANLNEPADYEQALRWVDEG